MRDTLAQKYNGERTLTIGRAAVLTQAHNGRAACHYCGPCHRGCITRSYFSAVNATLPAARKTGRMTLRPNSVVSRVIWDKRSGKVRGVEVIDALTRETMEFHARVVFLCASTMESARLLLLSTSPEWPDGLANSSGEVGHNLMDHTMGSSASATFDGWTDKRSIGRRPNGIYVPRFRNVKSAHPDFLRGYGMQGDGWRDHPDSDDTPGFGASYKATLRGWGPWQFGIGGWGECLPNHANHVSLDPEKRDAWGIPALRVDAHWGENDVKLVKDGALSAAEMLEAAGGKNIEVEDTPTPMGLCIHEMGTARMGRDPKTSVLNGWNQAHDIKNLFITDGACMASSGCQNPSITYMALTARAVDHAVKEMTRGEL